MSRAELGLLVLVLLAIAWGCWDRAERRRWERRLHQTKRKRMNDEN